MSLEILGSPGSLAYLLGFIDSFDCVFLQEAELERLSKAREQELSYKKEMDRLEVTKQERLAHIESQRFSQLVQSLGSDTLKEMARAGPELQVCFISTSRGQPSSRTDLRG